MFEDDEGKLEQFRDLTEVMENTGKKRPADNFTSSVMLKLYVEQDAPKNFLVRQSLSVRQMFPNALNFSLTNSVTKTECAFYFFLTGFFYLILGFILMLGLRTPALALDSRWLLYQPVFGIALASGLLIMGLAVYRDGGFSIRFVRVGTFIYAVLVVINGFTGAFFARISVAAFYDVIFSTTGLVTALLLAEALSRCYPETISQEVRG
jgi:hypothetical protein